MLSTIQSIQHISYNDTHVYLYFLMSIPRGSMLTPPYYYIISYKNLMDLFITHQLQSGSMATVHILFP